MKLKMMMVLISAASLSACASMHYDNGLDGGQNPAHARVQCQNHNQGGPGAEQAMRECMRAKTAQRRANDAGSN